MKKKKTLKAREYYVLHIDKFGIEDVVSGPHWSLTLANSLVEGFGKEWHTVAIREIELEYFAEDEDE